MNVDFQKKKANVWEVVSWTNSLDDTWSEVILSDEEDTGDNDDNIVVWNFGGADGEL